MGQLVEDQAADGVVGVVREHLFEPEPGEEVVVGALSVHEAAAVVAPHDVGLFARVGELAHERFEDVFQGDDAACDAEFVADDAVSQLLAAQLFEGVVDLESLVEELSGSQQRAQIERRGIEVQEEVFEVDHAQQFVQTAFADRVAVVGRAGHDFADFVGRHRHVDPHQLAAVRHDRLHCAVAQRKDAAHDLLLDLLHFAVFGALPDDRADFRLGHFALGLVQPQQAGDARRAFGE